MTVLRGVAHARALGLAAVATAVVWIALTLGWETQFAVEVRFPQQGRGVGAFEIAATVDYMFAFAATTGAVRTHHFDLAYDAFLADAETRNFIATNNPAALREIAQRFEEAAGRGLWTPRLNSAYDLLKELSQ